MNCKPGDLAFIVHSEAGNEGRIVLVLGPSRPKGPGANAYGELPLWWCEGQGSPLQDTFGFLNTEFNFPDAYLRPIRPDDLEEQVPSAMELEVTP